MGLVTIVWYGLTESSKEDYPVSSGRSSNINPIFIDQGGNSEIVGT